MQEAMHYSKVSFSRSALNELGQYRDAIVMASLDGDMQLNNTTMLHWAVVVVVVVFGISTWRLLVYSQFNNNNNN